MPVDEMMLQGQEPVGGGAAAEQLVRWETHLSPRITVQGFGMSLLLEQDPDTDHLGTTVWDSSIVTFRCIHMLVPVALFAE